MRRRRKALSTLVAALAAALVLGGCDSSSSSTPTEPVNEALFLVDSCPEMAGETYRLLIRDPAVIAEAERLIASGDRRIPLGELRSGDGGFNTPWSWHVAPDTVEFADFTVEVCSGCASFVENDLDAWLNHVGTYCPWSAVVLERVR